MRLALVQFNPTIGDLKANAGAIARLSGEAAKTGARLVIFPELALTGYPPRDLLLQEGFLEAVEAEAGTLASVLPAALAVLVGAPWRAQAAPAGSPGGARWARPTNSVLILRGGRIEARYDKRLLPTYDVFDEDRYFHAGDRPLVINVDGVPVGVSVCEDLWRGVDVGSSARYEGRADPVEELVRAGARLIVNPSASPFVLGKGERQRAILTRHVERHGVAIAAVNQVGGNDDLLFDGHSAVYVPAGGAARLIAAGPGFAEAIVPCDLPDDLRLWGSLAPAPDPLIEAPEESLLWRALVMGVRDYCAKTGFGRCVLGLSGGIDSALTACIAAAALGPANVQGIGMPSRYSSEGSVADARALAAAVGVPFALAPIEPAHAASERLLAPLFAEIGAAAPPGLTEENVQSRLRGLILMAVSNKTGAILLTTGNKSEVAVGYCTLYGDMNGGLAVLSDVTKAQVYRLSRWLNRCPAEAGFDRPPIPEASISKPPSAELRPNQTDQDTLPPYDTLDAIIERYVEGRRSPGCIARETGLDPELVRRVARMIDIAEYKRKQMPVGLKVTSITFGPGRRWPIAQRYRPEG